VNRLVVLRGAAFAQILAVPAALANTWLAEQDPKPTGALNLTLLVLVVGFAAGGFVAGNEAEHHAAKHGALAGLVAFVPVQVLGLLGRTGRGDPIAVGSILFLACLAAVAGTIGALVALRRSAGRQP